MPNISIVSTGVGVGVETGVGVGVKVGVGVGVSGSVGGLSSSLTLIE